MSTYELIRQAILGKKQVVAKHSGKQRYLCPHVLGIKDGKQRCFSYQFEGESTSKPIIFGSPANWRCMDVVDLSDVTLQDGSWHTTSNYSSSTQTCIDEVDVEVSLSGA